MPLLDILLYPDPRLRKQAKPVMRVTEDIQQLIDDMAETMYAAPGIGLAAELPGWLPALFLACYGVVFVATGLQRLAWATVQGKLIRDNRKDVFLYPASGLQ